MEEEKKEMTFSELIDTIAEGKGISRDSVLAALKEAMETSYIKFLKGGDDAIVEAKIIEEEDGSVHATLCQKKKIVKEVEDDYLEISKEDAKEDAEATIEHLEEEIDYLKRPRGEEKKEKEDLKYLLALVKEEKKNIKLNNFYSIYCPLNELTKLTAVSIRTILRNKIGEAERVALYDIYKDHIGEMLTGIVERSDEKGVAIKVGRTVIELNKKDMIGDEYFKPGETIKVYIQEVKSVDVDGVKKGPQIEVTRSSEGFLKRLFEEEIHEIYEGVVIIKGIARIAGLRSKVSVYSMKEDVDPTGACIGQGGSRIQKIVAQLGNSHEKEKIDIIPYSDDPALYIAESLRPAQVVGVAIKPEDEEGVKSAYAIVKDDQYYVALGKKNANIRLAKRLTGYSIDIKEETQAANDGIEYESIEDIRARVEEDKRAKERVNYAERSLRLAEEREALRQAEEKEKALQAEEEPIEVEEEEVVEETPVVVAKPAVTKVKPAKILDEVEPVAEPEPEKEPEPEVKVEVKTTTSLDELEKSLNAKTEKKAETGKKHVTKKEEKRPRKISEKEIAHEKPLEPLANAMPIYTEEELAEVEAEEENEADYYSEEDENLEYEYNDEYDDDIR
ncbi:MAG: transcription termination factor NusA [Bacilli bacterium]|nr:transcription termination factor NusA [Bacilli bacterium]